MPPPGLALVLCPGWRRRRHHPVARAEGEAAWTQDEGKAQPSMLQIQTEIRCQPRMPVPVPVPAPDAGAGAGASPGCRYRCQPRMPVPVPNTAAKMRDAP